jgi:branched-chain amino acid transport system permease protein
MPHRSKLPTICLLLMLAAVWIGLSFLVSNSYDRLLLTLVPIWALLGVSWNLFSGYCGLISFGHAAFFGLGAYTMTLSMVLFNLTPWLGIPLGASVGAMAGAAIGWPTFRLRGNYFALAMLASPLMLGYQEVTIPLHNEAPVWFMQFHDDRVYVVIAVLLLLVGLLISLFVERSRFGMCLVATKQNELAAEAAGINTRRWKMLAIILSGAIAAAAGGLYAVVLLVVTPASVFGLVVSAQAMILVLFGGAGTFWGPLIGAVVLVPLGEVLQAQLGARLPGIQGVLYGIAVIAVVLLAPEGLYWKLHDLLRGKTRASASPHQAFTLPTIPPPQPKRPPPSETLLSVSGLSKSFGGVAAIQNVGFTIRAHEILGIIGPNGAGKTTLFNLLNGVVAPSSGTIRFNGQDIVGMRTNRIAQLGISRTFQVVRAFPRMTVLENVVVGAYPTNASDSLAWSAASRAVEQVGLTPFAGATAGSLTNRELRLMELARALAGSPSLLLLDEPLAGLGAGDTEELMAVVRRLPELGVTVAIIEHTMQAMLGLVDRFIVLDQGKLLTEGAPAEVMRRPEVIEAYLGRKWAVTDAAA